MIFGSKEKVRIADPTKPHPGTLAQIACLLEVTARKPGNVHRFRDFEDTTYFDFVLSASAIAGPLEHPTSLGRAVLGCVEATRGIISTNTNLGMVLLLAPLAMADGDRDRLADILASSNVEDADLVYQAIRLAKPGGLGTADDQDVSDRPTVTLVEAMRMAADRDLVARQYANGFADIFDEFAPTLRAWIEAGRPLETSIVGAYLTFLASHPDTLIARKRGLDVAIEASSRARAVLDAGWPDVDGVFEAFDDWLRADGHARNPGATADLVAAGLFVALRDGTIGLPLRGD